MGIIQKIFGTRSEREVKKLMPLVTRIESMEDEMKALTDEQLREKTDEFRKRYQGGEDLDDLLPEAFAVCREAAEKGADLLVTHHPLIFHAPKSVTDETDVGRSILFLARHGICAVNAHTNLDCAPGGVNDALAAALGLEDPGPLGDPEGLCRMGTLAKEMPLHQFAQHVCRCLGANGVRYADAGRPVRRVAVGGGACGDYESYAIAAGCDTFVTSDLTYHTFLDAPGKGINLLDAGHFPTEDPVCARLVAYLQEQFPQLTVMKSTSHREVIQYYVEGE